MHRLFGDTPGQDLAALPVLDSHKIHIVPTHGDIGDIRHLLGILKSGSYAVTASFLLLLSHETPIEVLILDNKISIIRNRNRLIDLN
jgi:hypothetical protein